MRRAVVGEEKRSLASRLRRRLGPFVILLPLVLLAVLVFAGILYVRPEASESGESAGLRLPGFVRRWQERRVEARLNEIWRLTDEGDAEAVKRLIRLLRDSDESVRDAAARSLGEIKDPRAVEPLIAALKDSDTDVREKAAWSLGIIGDLRAVEALIAALKDRDRDVRQTAAWSLGEIKDPRVVEPLITALRDGDGDVRQTAEWSLGRINDSRAVKPLIAALKDSNEYVRWAAADALKAITGADFGTDPEKWRKWWEEQKQRSGVSGQGSAP